MGFVFGHLWPRARREKLQQDLFQLRNDLFIFMKENDFAFDEPAYIEVRNSLNATIRFCELFNMPSVIVTALVMRREKASLPASIERCTDAKLRSKLRSVNRLQAIRVFKFLLLSPNATPFVCGFILFAAIRQGTRIINPLFRSVIDQFAAHPEFEPLVKITECSRPVVAFMYQARHETDRTFANHRLYSGTRCVEEACLE